MEGANPLINDMYTAKCHIGYRKTRRHPSIIDFVYTTKNRLDVLDLEQSSAQLVKAMEFIKTLAAEKKQVLFVGTKPENKHITKNVADSLAMPYVEERWIGGTLTNFKEIRGRVDKLDRLMDQQDKGTLVFQTKKEKLMIEREIGKLTKRFSGILPLKQKPAALFVIDSRHEDIAVKEANRLKIPVVSISNSDCDISGIQYPIVANDTAISSIMFITNAIAAAYKQASA